MAPDRRRPKARHDNERLLRRNLSPGGLTGGSQPPSPAGAVVQAGRWESPDDHRLNPIANNTSNPRLRPVKFANLARLGCLAAGFALRSALPGAFAQATPPQPAVDVQVHVTLPTSTRQTALTGRIFLYVGATNNPEPRDRSRGMFGQDVHAAQPGQTIVLAEAARGSPDATLNDLAPGDYYVQALWNVYTEFRRSDGHTIWAHMDQWEGQNFAKSPGNFYSEPQALHVEAGRPARVKVTLAREIPPIQVPPDNEWVQRFKFQSPRLTKFWGQPIFLGATVLLPKGYAEHPRQHYPVIYCQGHFSLDSPFGFNPQPDPTGRKSWARQRAEAAAQHLPPPAPPAGTELVGSLSNQETPHEFYEAWTSDDFPRFIAVSFQHPTPYFDDSYGVNSANCGPYGDAIMKELIPAFEKRFRTIKKSSARLLTGSSTGGWGSLALQLYHPDFFGGAWAFSPDPVDFRLYYGGVNIYEEDNAFVEKTAPGFDGGGLSNRRGSQRASILGTQDGRFEWWKHTPCGPDGYPLPVWDLATGKIDRAVVQHLRENNYDLREYTARNWSRLGPKLIGKLHVCAADTDGYYSHLAVRLLDEFMQSTRNPHERGTFQYGPPGSHHGWQPTSNEELIREMARHYQSHQRH